MASAIGDLAIRNSSQAAVGYFVDQKKGEVNELKQLLKNLNVERDLRRKREIIKKVIAYMTLGIDVSRLFTDMVMAVETKDIVIKKMVYLFLCNYAHVQPELAIMCINSLRRECENEDPTVRGLALRSLCSLRLDSILEYIEQPLQRSFTDISSYVRKTGVMGILKLYQLSPQLVLTHGYIDRLYAMLNDADATVVINAIYVINELQVDKGGLEVTQSIIMTLLNRIGEFTEWGLNTILALICKYKPLNEDETYAIMNLLDPVLRTANSGAVLATMKCFLCLTAQMPDLQPQIYERAKAPLLTLVTGAHSESQFCILKHLELMLRQPAARGIFDDEFRQFFVRYNETPHVKHLKVQLLPLIANHRNARDIASELGEYVTDVDAELSKTAIRALGQIAMHIAPVSEEMTMALLQLIDMDSSYVRSEAARVLVDVVRVAPQMTNMCLPYLSRMLKRVSSADDAAGADAKAALVWMLGEYGAHTLVEAPYMLESIIDGYEEEESVVIKLQLLTAAMKLFFQRPPEVQLMLGKLFSFALNETGNQDLHDRALLYYRLLSTDIEAAKQMFQPGVASGLVNNVGFIEDRASERVNKLFSEFNTLAVVYGAPSEQFIGEKYQFKSGNIPEMEVIDVLTPQVLTPVPAATSTAVETAIGIGQQQQSSSSSSSQAATVLDDAVQQQQQQQQPLPVTLSTAVEADSQVPVGAGGGGGGEVATMAVESATLSVSAPVSVPVPDTMNLLDLDDDAPPAANNKIPPQTQAPTPTPAQLQLVDAVGLFTPVQFQQRWGKLADAFGGRICLVGRNPASAADVESALRAQKVVVMASGPLPPGGSVTGVKLFAFASGKLPAPVSTATVDTTANFLVQLVQVNESNEIRATVKTDATAMPVGEAANLFVDILVAAFGAFQPAPAR